MLLGQRKLGVQEFARPLWPRHGESQVGFSGRHVELELDERAAFPFVGDEAGQCIEG